jgi:hypothetical protein
MIESSEGDRPMRNVAALLPLLLFIQSCSLERKPSDICKAEHFTKSRWEHFIEEIKQPIVVSIVKGKITNAQGGWPDNWPVLFEIRRTRKSAKTIQAYANVEGNFEIPDIAEGHYCFKATVEGWRSTIGTIIVDRKADPKKTILIVMKLGV